jgi:hypothetical protein
LANPGTVWRDWKRVDEVYSNVIDRKGVKAMKTNKTAEKAAF